MRESIGTTFMLNFILLFLFLVFAFLAGTISYYRAYMVNNIIMNAIERYEGYNDFSRAEISRRLSGVGYEFDVGAGAGNRQGGRGCPPYRADNSLTFPGMSELAPRGELHQWHADDPLHVGYCIFVYWPDVASQTVGGHPQTTDVWYSYGVLTYMYLRFPVLEARLRIPIFSRTNRMYDFEMSRPGYGDGPSC